MGFLGAGLLGRWLGDRASQWITCGFMGLSMMVGWLIFKEVVLEGASVTIPLGEWISFGALEAPWSLRFDPLSGVMIGIVTTISTLVHVYSVGYMAHDEGIARFMAYLSLFTFLMLMLVTADNLVQLFFGWEGVGLASYLLIGFWHKKDSANQASMKAFIVNRVGDVAFVLGIATLYLTFHCVQFDQIFAQIPQVTDLTQPFLGLEVAPLSLIAFLLFMGATGKSAQLGLHVWLPDAMEGPTPVSALIHAATMVTAGVFLVSRFSPVFEHAPGVLSFMTGLGATTALFAASIALTQNDVKRVIAYSTCSQLGYMFFAAGVSAYSASLFHLVTHAFFKALLFLGAGSIIHAMSEEQNMQRMGGLASLIPVTYGLMWIGSLALSGIPGFSGYYSKDMILESAWAAGTSVGYYAFWMGLMTAFLTALYGARLLFLVFHGTSHAGEKVQAHIHESPLTMLVPMGLLAMGAVLSGVIFQGWMEVDGFWGLCLFKLAEQGGDPHGVPSWVKLAPTVAGMGGLGVAAWIYLMRPQLPDKIAHSFSTFYKLAFHKWYVDEAYGAWIVQPLHRAGKFLGQVVDPRLIDEGGPNFMARLLVKISGILGKAHRGSLYDDLVIMLVGLLTIIFISFCQGVL
jgi:NADH-quinone oxidoreductase subunit L